jgi:ATP-dependent Clp protease adaptor protein ClpS
VLLHNSDEPTMEDVIRAIVELTPHNVKRAVQIMMEAHTTGVSLVLVTHKERAELYEEQFRSVLLTVTIEPE